MMLPDRTGLMTLALALLISIAGSIQAQPAHSSHSSSSSAVQENPHLRKMLLGMVDADQKARTKLISDMSTAGKPTSQDIRRIKSLDAAHVARLKKIFNEYGWPGYTLVGKKGSNAAWLLVQHADQNGRFQKHALALLKKAVDKGQASKPNLAYLTDEVRVAEGKAQIYGTQMKTIGKGATARQAPYPIKNKGQVDERRKSMDLLPLKEHMKLIQGATSGTSKKSNG